MVTVPGPQMPPRMTSPFPVTAPVAAPEPVSNVTTTTADITPLVAGGTPIMPGGDVPIIGIPNSQDYPRILYTAPYFGTFPMTLGPYLPLGGGTMTGPVDLWRVYSVGPASFSGPGLFPTRGIYEEYDIGGTVIGTQGSMWFFGANDTANVGASNFWIPFVINHNFNGAVGTGNRDTLDVTLTVANGVASTFYTAGQFNATLNSGSGDILGLNPYITVAAGSANTTEAVGIESDMDIRANVTRKVGMQVVDIATSTGVGSVGLDAGLVVAREPGSAGFAAGLQFGESIAGSGVAGSNGVRPTGTILKVWPGTNAAGQPDFANGVDFSGLTITGNAFASPGFNVLGTGAVGALGVTIANGQWYSAYNNAAVGRQLMSLGTDNNLYFGQTDLTLLIRGYDIIMNGPVQASGSMALGGATIGGARLTFDTTIATTPGTINKIDFYDGLYGIGLSSGALDIVSGAVTRFWSGTTPAVTIGVSSGWGHINPAGGYTTQPGLGGTAETHVFNLSWGASGPFHLWVDNADQGSINVTPCDIRLKKNVVPATHDALAAINAVELKEFDFLETSVSPERHEKIGFTAQQLIEAIPEAVYAKDDPDAMWSVQLTPIVSYLIGAVQQLSQKVAELEARAR